MGEIASHTALPAPTATRIVDRLVTQRLAYRSADPLDRRRVLVHLGAEGRSVVESVCRRVQRLLTPRRHPVHGRQPDSPIPGPRSGAL